MKRCEIESKIRDILEEANLLEEVEGEKRIIQDIDSIQLISIIVEIEEYFEIEIPDSYLATDILNDFAHLVDVVEEVITAQHII